jgi:hypothetical protein
MRQRGRVLFRSTIQAIIWREQKPRNLSGYTVSDGIRSGDFPIWRRYSGIGTHKGLHLHSNGHKNMERTSCRHEQCQNIECAIYKVQTLHHLSNSYIPQHPEKIRFCAIRNWIYIWSTAYVFLIPTQRKMMGRRKTVRPSVLSPSSILRLTAFSIPQGIIRSAFQKYYISITSIRSFFPSFFCRRLLKRLFHSEIAVTQRVSVVVIKQRLQIYRNGDSDMEWASSIDKKRYSTGVVAISLQRDSNTEQSKINFW